MHVPLLNMSAQMQGLIFMPPTSEYPAFPMHNHVNKNNAKVVCRMNHKNNAVRVRVEFPKQSDERAEQEFVGRLKELYLDELFSAAPAKDEGENEP